MANIPYPTTLEGWAELPRTRNALVNCWNNGKHIVGRPGITGLSTPAGVARGGFVWNGNLYGIYSETLYSFNAVTGVATTIDTIEGSGPISVAIGFNHACIVAREASGKGYILDSSDTVTEITDSQFVASNSVAHINGRFVFIPFNGDPAFFSNVGDATTIDTDAFFDAEELPDKNKISFNWKNFLVIGGEDSFEFFRDQGRVPVPYVRQSMRVDFGYIGGLIEFKDSWAFIGREQQEDAGIYVLSRGTAEKISNDYIDTILATYSEDQLAAAKSGRLKWRGDEVIYFIIGNDSFGFNGGWIELSTNNLVWAGGYVVQFNQKYYSFGSNNFGFLALVGTDYGQDFEKRIDLGFYEENNDGFTAQSIELGISQGYNGLETGTVGISISEDNVLYGPTIYRDVGAEGDYKTALYWDYPGGLGFFENGFMGVRIVTTADIDFSSDKLLVNYR